MNVKLSLIGWLEMPRPMAIEHPSCIALVYKNWASILLWPIQNFRCSYFDNRFIPVPFVWFLLQGVKLEFLIEWFEITKLYIKQSYIFWVCTSETRMICLLANCPLLHWQREIVSQYDASCLLIHHSERRVYFLGLCHVY
jgi:hypothetical protein